MLLRNCTRGGRKRAHLELLHGKVNLEIVRDVDFEQESGEEFAGTTVFLLVCFAVALGKDDDACIINVLLVVIPSVINHATSY